jgi:catechol 2,3-dioxygenase-like lactoylglutathione lyase family enzyme
MRLSNPSTNGDPRKSTAREDFCRLRAVSPIRARDVKQMKATPPIDRSRSFRCLQEGKAVGVEIEFVASIAVIVADPPQSRQLYMDALGLPLEGEGVEGYYHSEQIEGTKHFGVWPLTQAAHACFGTSEWPANRPIPQVSIEFEVESAAEVQRAAEEMQAEGLSLLHPAREEPWGQTVARLLAVDGPIIGLSYTPALRN